MARAIFMGSDAFSLPILRALLDGGTALTPAVETVAVVTQPDRPAGRGRQLAPNAVKTEALEQGLPVLQPRRVRDPESVAAILELEPDLLVVASFGQILPRALLDQPPHRALNLHPSLLPRFRGPSPIAGAILDGANETGVTLMQMSAKMDAGPILDQVEANVEPNVTAGALRDRLAQVAADLLIRDLPRWLRDELAPRPQDESLATYTSLIRKEDGEIDWSEPAALLARKVRAYNPWPVAYTGWRGRQLRLLEAQPVRGVAAPGQVQGLQGDKLLIGTGDGLLGAGRLQLAGGKPLTASELIRGHPSLLEARLGQEAAWSSA
jgi:methionyl-tRNA formyltransferase